MYVTRRLSVYLADPSATAEPPPEGPGSGFLVVVDETGETARTRCWGMCVDREMRGLPFPQNRQLALRESSSSSPLESCATFIDFVGEIVGTCTGIQSGRAPGSKAPKVPDYAMLLPVVGQPLSSGRYYVVQVGGKHRGKVSACSKEEDKTTCCFGCSCVNDVKPRPLDRRDLYQQVEVQRLPSSSGFMAVAVAADGIPPHHLRKKGWKVNTMMSPRYDLTDALGVDSALRRRMPDLDDSLSVVVGRWYVPFMFVKADGERSLKEQSRRCTFYEMTMEQSWEQIYCRDDPAAEVAVTATVRRSTALLGGTGVQVQEGWPHADDDGGTVWFRPAAAAAAATVGLDVVLWERMRWEADKGGWVAPAGNGDEERIERVERHDDVAQLVGHGHKFRCYLLVERFLLKRMDGSLALTCEFRHTDKIKAKWL